MTLDTPNTTEVMKNDLHTVDLKNGSILPVIKYDVIAENLDGPSCDNKLSDVRLKNTHSRDDNSTDGVESGNSKSVVQEQVKTPNKKKKTSTALAKLLEDSMWYIESSGGNKVRESSLKIERLKEEKLSQMINDDEQEADEENEDLPTPEELAEQEMKKQLRRQKAKEAMLARKKEQEEKRLLNKQKRDERKRLIAEGKIVPTPKKIPQIDPNIDLNDLDSSSYYGGGHIAQLLKASAYFTNQGKKFDGSRREVKPVERLLEDVEYAKQLRRTSSGRGKTLKQKLPTLNTDKKKPKTKSNPKEKNSVKTKKKNNTEQRSDTEKQQPGQGQGPGPEPEPEPEQEEEKIPEPIWFTDITIDDLQISEDWKFYEDFVYQNQNDNYIPEKITHAADIIRNTIKIYRTDHENYKLQRVDLHFPFSEYKEHYLLALPKDDIQFNPFDEIGKSMELMTLMFFPDEYKSKVMNLEEPENCIIGKYIDAFENNDVENLLKCIGEFNLLIDTLRNDGKILEYVRNRKTFPKSAIFELLNQCYSRRVLPESKKLSNYKAFSNEVYGELMPQFLSTIYSQCNLNSKSCFIDLGSGVGNCVIQAALEFGAESYGVEIVENASRLGDLQLEEFKSRCRIYGLKPGFVKLFAKQSFVDNENVSEIVDRCNVILVNNYLFDTKLNKKVIELFQNLKVGTKIISLKPIVPATHKIDWDNCSSVINRLKTSKFIYKENSVSWTSKGGFYYITEVMNEILEDNFVVFKSRESRRRDEGLDERSRSDTPLNAFTNNV